MATLQIKNSTITADLLAGDLQLEDSDVWEALASGEWERFDLASVATNDAAMRAAKINLDKLEYLIKLYGADQNESDPVGVYWQSEGESAKQALVYELASSIKSGKYLTPLLGKNGKALLSAAVRRSAWENTTGTVLACPTQLSGLGGTWVMGNASGTLPGRIAITDITSQASSIHRLYMGIRDLGYGSTGFKSLWEAEFGTMGVDCTSLVDGTASNSSCMRVTFATRSVLDERMKISWGQVQTVSNWSHIIGRYLVLARTRLTSGTKVYVEMRHGYGISEIAGYQYLDETRNANLQNWNLIRMGTVQIPTTGNRDNIALIDNIIKSYSLRIWAERLSASGELHIDAFVLIPVDRYAILTPQQFGAGAFIGSGQGTAHIYVGPDGHATGLHKTTGVTPEGTGVDLSLENWGYPVRGGIMVVAASRLNDHVLTSTINPTVTIFPRWKSYRD